MNVIRAIADWFQGKKWNIATVGGAIYALGANKGWWPRDPEIEVLIVAALSLAFRSALRKLS